MITDRHPYQILVIEDNPGDFAIVEEFILEQILSPVIIQATSFTQTASILATQKNGFDIILLDVSLPDNSGKALVTETLTLAGNTPVIILTGYTDIEFSIQSVLLGVSDYLLKDELNATALYKSMMHAIERKKIIVNLEESEKRYSNLFHLSPLPMFVCEEISSRILDINRAAILHYGYSAEELLLMTIHDIEFMQGSLVLKEGAIDESFSTDKVQGYHYTQHIKKNGEVIKVDIRKNYVLFKGKDANLLLINDITERMQYIEAIEKQNKQLREIAWMQSHLVRAPLARMMGIVNVLNQLDTSIEDQKLLINGFIESGMELDSIINEITCKTKSIHIFE